MSSFDFLKMLSHIETYRISLLLVVPPILNAMAKHPQARKADLSSVETIGSGAAPLPTSTQAEVNKLMQPHGTRIRSGWGMTELTCSALSWDPTRPDRPGVGELSPNCKGRLFDTDTGEEITSANTPGELCIAAPGLMRAYWRNPKATAETIFTDADGTRWLRTGDVAYVDEYATGTIFHIVDRLKELIKVKGYQVAPAELESLLLERNDVTDAAVVGVTVNGEEVPRAYIVKAPDSKASTEDIARWVAEQVAHYKQLKGGVVFTDAIPKNLVRGLLPFLFSFLPMVRSTDPTMKIQSGKILRKALRDQAKREVEGRPKL